ncbi:MAG: FmdE family protein [Thermodesulfobacteriota bacterium]|nr:FmdE family protein [Thermodesulfobacteriota bacterium]
MTNQTIERQTSPWCQDHEGNFYSYDELLERIRSFHGHVAPGVVIGAAMVHKALKMIPEGILFDVICETFNCLPDSVQLLTPCTVGNGWLKIYDFGRFALTLYDKYEGKGIRVFMDSEKVKDWPEIKNWYLKLIPKREQDSSLLMENIRRAWGNILSCQEVEIAPSFREKRGIGEVILCPLCKEAYPFRDGDICRPCQGESPYILKGHLCEDESSPPLKKIPVEKAVGHRALHDMTMIIPKKKKGPLYKNGQRITVGDLCRLQQMGRQSLYVIEENRVDSKWVHEDEAAMAFGRYMAGDGVRFTESPSEGKVNFTAERNGLFVTDEKKVEIFNLLPGVMCACRHGYTVVTRGDSLAGTRAIPLYLRRSEFNNAISLLRETPLFRVAEIHRTNVGVLVTGTEVFQGWIEDAFIPIVRSKVEKFGCHVLQSLIVPDERKAICKGVKNLLGMGIELLITTAGLSVDPDDVTRQGLIDAGLEKTLYGAPILPGAMTLLGRIGSTHVIGVPACALYFKNTSLDLLLPRLLAGLDITRIDLARMGHGAFCLECKKCTFPMCSFGK